MSKTLEDIIDSFPDETFLKADGLDDAVIGLDYNSHRLIYSVSKCIDIVTEWCDGNVEEAIEYLDYNTFCAYVGEDTPIWCDDRYAPVVE